MTSLYKKSLITIVVVAIASLHLPAEGREFRLGLVSEKPVEKKISGYTPLARHVAERLKEFGVTGGKVVVVGDVDAMVRKIRRKEVDVVLESAFPTLIMKRRAGMIPKLLVWKEGVREYRTLFFVRKDSRIAKLSELKGKTLVLQDPESTSAFLIPIAELKRNGVNIAPAKAKAAPAVAKYVLVAHEKNQAFWVIEKRADAGAFSSDDWEDLPAAVRADLKIIHQTRPVIRYLASFDPDLPPELAGAMATVMDRMDENPGGRDVLKNASNTTKIEPLSKRDYDSLEYVRQLMAGVAASR